MELAPVPTRPSLMGRLWLVVAVAVLAPLVLLVVLPMVLGLERYVVTSDALGDSVPRGSLTFAERVPGNDLRDGDVITFRPPSQPPSAPLVTRRVESVSSTGIRTAAEDTGTDPWVLALGADRARVVWHIPYIGYPFSGGVQPAVWVMLASVPMLAVLLAVVADLERARQRRRAVRRQEHLHMTDV